MAQNNYPDGAAGVVVSAEPSDFSFDSCDVVETDAVTGMEVGTDAGTEAGTEAELLGDSPILTSSRALVKFTRSTKKKIIRNDRFIQLDF